LSEPRLSLSSLRCLPPELRPLVDPASLAVGVVHLGVGAFHRAHQVDFLEDAALASGDGSFGVCAFSERSPDAATRLAEQDGLYSLRTVSAGSSCLRVLASVREVGFAPAGGVVERLADPAVQLVTLTVTEKGYRHDPATGRLRLADAAVLADARALASGHASAGPPATVVGQLAHGLAARQRAGAGPLSILSCDNLPANGRLLAGLVADFLDLADDLAGVAAGLRSFVDEEVSFPSSMVDRIVPAATAADRELAQAALGVVDEAAVVAEPFRQWVLEDRFAGRRPVGLEAAGALLVTEVAPYEALKLRVLNGSHSALAYLGALMGCDLIAEALAEPALEAFVRALVDREVGPTLTLPGDTSLAGYRDAVLERFANPLLAHRCLQVASDGSQKLPQRILQTVRENLAAGAEPHRALLVVAAWVRAVCHGRDERGRAVEISDPLATELRRRAGDDPTAAQLAARALSLGEVFDTDLGTDPTTRALLASALSDLASGRVAEVAAAYALG
jgi:fructuronate reductase